MQKVTGLIGDVFRAIERFNSLEGAECTADTVAARGTDIVEAYEKVKSYLLENLVTVEGFWECECSHDYIHPDYPVFNDIGTCPKCGAYRKDMPDARLSEMIFGTGEPKIKKI